MNKTKIKFIPDRKELESLRVDVTNNIKESDGIEIECPQCHYSVHLSGNETRCPNCNSCITLGNDEI